MNYDNLAKDVSIVSTEHSVPTTDRNGIPSTRVFNAGTVVTVGGKIVSSSMRERLGLDTRRKIDADCLEEINIGQEPKSTSRYSNAFSTPSNSRVRLLG